MFLGDDDLKDLAKQAGVYDMPAIKALVNSPLLQKDRKFKLARWLGARAAIRNPNPHPFLPAPGREQAGNGIAELGLVVTGVGPEYPFRFGEDMFLSHVGIAGSTGGGKTVILAALTMQLHRAGRAVWWFDTEGDLAAYVVAHAPDVLVISPKDLRLALFDGPEGVAWEEYINKLIGTFPDTLRALEGMQNMAREICLNLRGKLGSFTIHDFFDELGRRRYRADSRSSKYWDSLCNRFQGSLIPFLGDTYGSGSHDVRALMRRSVVWMLGGLSEDLLKFFVTVLLLWVDLASPVVANPRLMLEIGLDESTRVFGTKQDKSLGKGESFVIDFMRTCRKRQIGVLHATQTPQLLADQVLSVTNSWVVLRAPDGRFLRCMSDVLDLDRDGEQSLMELPDRKPRRAVVRCPGIPEPFLVELPEY